ncbi:RNB domain-containing ribonuclease [Sphingomonas oligophenolica]|uniref:RNB domain-containing ribonuclease n=1 Tax=Sphingomonas oligophenolica TaxID=301154 RepID=A0A502CJ79_9SPHN|nr:RNB domain-containing ribonuclease [Sphingomonas oligophenolica]TPG12129.1 RNB domain-containing ribonuclease [Sphingomonas oligophenolica]
MKTLADPQHALADGLDAIRAEFQVPDGFPPAVLAAAAEAAKRQPTDHVDRTNRAFVTLDPATSTDLDQAFAIEAAGADLLLHYAIADVAWFVDDDGVIDREAWTRGETLYLPDRKAGLYPPILAEGAASLLPDGPRPAIVFTVRIDPSGAVALDGVERALIRSRAKLAYATAIDADLPAGFADLATRIQRDERRRGASRVDPPEQEVERVDGALALRFRPRLVAEDRNAALSLATNMAVGQALLAHHTGLFRVMAAPDDAAKLRLRNTAKAFALAWPDAQPLADFTRTLDAAQPRAAAFMLAVRRAGHGASYAPWHDGETPWHAAVAATYAQATAPLRRLADRYVIRAAVAVANGQPVPAVVTAAFDRLPKVIARADATAGRIDRAVIDLAEAIMLRSRVGDSFAAVVTDTDDRGARIQLSDYPIIARVDTTAMPGDALIVRLAAIDMQRRTIEFKRVH